MKLFEQHPLPWSVQSFDGSASVVDANGGLIIFSEEVKDEGEFVDMDCAHLSELVNVINLQERK